MRFLAIALATLLAGCASHEGGASAGAVTVKPAQANDVAGCRYVDDVSSVSGRYGIFASGALEDTRAEVLQRAAAAGATHIVWRQPQVVYGSTTSSGKAYRCN